MWLNDETKVATFGKNFWKIYLAAKQDSQACQAWWWHHHAVEQFLLSWNMRSKQDKRNHWWGQISILAQNLQVSDRQVKIKKNATLQHSYNPKHKSKSTKPWLHKKSINVLKWLSQSPSQLYQKSVEWLDECPCNLIDLEHYCKKKNSNTITKSRFAWSYPNIIFLKI